MTSSQRPFENRKRYKVGRTTLITARPRIHVGLVDLGLASERCFGGVGFNIDGHCTIWRITQTQGYTLENIDKVDDLAQQQLNALAHKLHLLTKPSGFTATLVSAPQQHVGFGSKTTLTLGLAKGVAEACRLPLSPTEIIRISGRGGASGAGVHLFFTGGVVWDGGHKATAEAQLLPSGARTPPDPPPLLGRWDFPANWRVALILPKGRSVFGDDEERFFCDNTPTSRMAALETMAAMYHDIIPAFVTGDLSLLRTGLKVLHNTGFKQRELGAQDATTRHLLSHLQEHTPAGMSSMGPLLYTLFHQSDTAAPAIVLDACEKFGAAFLGTYEGWNSSHRTDAL